MPFIIKAPRFVGGDVGGSTCSVPVSGIDIYATVVDLLGLDLPPSAVHAVDGLSLVPLLRGWGGSTHQQREQERRREGNQTVGSASQLVALMTRPIFTHEPHYGNQGGEPTSSILQSDMKLIYYHEDSRTELYDLSSDAAETSDLSSLPSHVATTASLRERLQRWLDQTAARFPAADPEFGE